MADRFSVECPSCGTETVPISVDATKFSRACSCGTWFAVDMEGQEVREHHDR